MHTNDNIMMKHGFLLLAAAVFTMVMAPVQSCPAAPDARALGEHFVDLMARKDFAAAVAQCDGTMKAAMPEAKLKTIWESVQGQVGAYQKRIHARMTKTAGYDIAFVTCEFERAKLDAKVVLNSEGRVSGLFFVPSTADANVDPEGPPPYVRTNAFREREFSVGSGEWALPGTLAMPAESTSKPCPAVVLVHGSGPNDRDESVGGIKVFRDLAWGLASRGIAVLRYDKRTKVYGAKYMAEPPRHITVKEETIDDALAAAEQLRAVAGIDPKRVFVLGHSLGATVAPRIGLGDSQLAGLIMMAGATRPLEDIIVEQTRYLTSLSPESAEGEAKVREMETLRARIKMLTDTDVERSTILLGAPPAYWLDLRAHDPVAAAKTVKLPMLILQGGRDYQVTHGNYDDWKSGLSAMPNVTFKWYPHLNHLFVTGDGKSTPQEYDQPGFVEKAVVDDIAQWISAVR